MGLRGEFVLGTSKKSLKNEEECNQVLANFSIDYFTMLQMGIFTYRSTPKFAKG